MVNIPVKIVQFCGKKIIALVITNELMVSDMGGVIVAC